MQKRKGFTLIEAASMIIILGCMAGSMLGRKVKLDQATHQNQFTAMVSALELGWNTVYSAKRIKANTANGFSDGQNLYCFFGTSTALLATFAPTTPTSVCDSLTYAAQSQSTRNNYCQSIFTGLLRQPPAIAGLASENFPPVPSGFTGSLTPALRALIPDPNNYPGFLWVGMDDANPATNTCTFVYLPGQGYGQVWLVQYNRGTSTFANYQLSVF